MAAAMETGETGELCGIGNAFSQGMWTWAPSGHAQEEGSPGTNPPKAQLCTTGWKLCRLVLAWSVVAQMPVSAPVLCVEDGLRYHIL